MAVAELTETNTMLLEKLLELQRALDRLQGSASDIAGVTSATDLRLLQQAVSWLSSHSLEAKEKDSGEAVFEAVSRCLELLMQQLQELCADFYSSNGGPPCETPAELELPGTLYKNVLVAKLQLMRLLLQQVGQIELTLPSEQQQEAAAAEAEAARRDRSRARNRPSYVVGIVEISEEDSSSTATAEQQHQARLQRLALQAILVCALYANRIANNISSSTTAGTAEAQAAAGPVQQTSDVEAAASSSNSSRSTSSSKATYNSSFELDEFCADVMQQGLEIFAPWSSKQCQQQAQDLLWYITANIVVAGADAVTTDTPATVTAASQRRSPHAAGSTSATQAAAATAAKSATEASDNVSQLSQQLQDQVHIQPHGSDRQGVGNAQQKQQQQYQQWQGILNALLPQLLDCLRDTLLAQHRHKKVQDRGDVVAYKGPDTFNRCLAARQLAWIIQQLNTSSLTQDTCGLLLPLVLSTADDPAPAVQRYGHAMLSWLAVQSQPGSLTWQRVLLLDEAKRLVVGCEESCWISAMPAATNLVVALEGKQNVRSTGYHTLVRELITEAERNAQQPKKRLIFMACMAKLIPCVGLYIVRYFSQLMPLLLEWTHAFDEDTAVMAVQLLGRIVQYAWPRMEVHAGVIWEHVVEVARSADERAWMNSVGSSREDVGASYKLILSLVQLIHLLSKCGGRTFRTAVDATASDVSDDGGGGDGLSKSVKQLLFAAGKGS